MSERRERAVLMRLIALGALVLGGLHDSFFQGTLS